MAPPALKASDLLLKVGLLAALLWGVCYAVASGVEPTIGHGPVPGWMVFGVVLPTFFSSVVAGLSLPVWLVLRIIGTRRQLAAGKQLTAADALVEGLASRDLSEAAAAVDARARGLGRVVVEADLAEAMEQDLLAAIADCRAAIRGDPPAEALAVAAAELSALEDAVRGHRTARFSEEDASAPLARLRAASRALQA